jgi:hypothetical protein
MLVVFCGRASKLSWITKGNPAWSCPVTELNAFYALFEASNTEPCMRAPGLPADCVIMLSVADVSKTFKQVNSHKAAGPDA